MSELLDRFGVQLSKNRAQYPFWRLQNDSIWEIQNSELYKENSSGDVSAKELKNNNAKGGFKDIYYEKLKSH